MLKTEKISVAEADTECTMAFKECSIFQLAIPVLQVQREVLTWEDKSLSSQSPFTENENRWTAQKCEVLTFCSLGIEFQILPQSRKVNLPSAYVKLS